MKQERGEAEAISRVASAAREVLSATEALEEHAKAEGNEGSRALHLARLATAVDDPSGFASMAIVTYRGDDRCESSALGSFEAEADPCQFALAFTKAESERRLLMTLIERRCV